MRLPFAFPRLGRFLLLVVATAFASTLTRAPAQPAAPKSVARISSYKLQPMDFLRIQIFQEPDLDRELRISQDYKIVLPLIGVVDAKDRTVRETELLITELYRRDYLVNPQVNLTILEYAPRSVTVLGAVNSPGTVALPPERNLTLLEAIARSGGFSRLANRRLISLTRTQPDGQTVNVTLNGDQMVAGDADNGWVVLDGDIVSIPERLL